MDSTMKSKLSFAEKLTMYSCFLFNISSMIYLGYIGYYFSKDQILPNYRPSSKRGKKKIFYLTSESFFISLRTGRILADGLFPGSIHFLVVYKIRDFRWSFKFAIPII